MIDTNLLIEEANALTVNGADPEYVRGIVELIIGVIGGTPDHLEAVEALITMPREPRSLICNLIDYLGGR